MKWLKFLSAPTKPLDKLQLEAAQDRFYQRKKDLGEAADELSQMLKRMTVGRDKRRGKLRTSSNRSH